MYANEALAPTTRMAPTAIAYGYLTTEGDGYRTIDGASAGAPIYSGAVGPQRFMASLFASVNGGQNRTNVLMKAHAEGGNVFKVAPFQNPPGSTRDAGYRTDRLTMLAANAFAD